MPDIRLGRIAELIILGIFGGQTPIITCMACQSSKDEGETWAVAKNIYRWLENERFDCRDLFASLYEIGQQVVTAESPAYLVVAVDPVNFEKPYAKAVEGVSVVHKASSPALDGRLLSKFCLPMPARIAWTQCNSAGSKFASLAQCVIYGSRWPMTRPSTASWS